MKPKHFLLSLLIGLNCGVLAENWSAFRGTLGNGVSQETSFPVSWGSDQNIAWKVDLSGKGTSSPIVHGDHVFVTLQQENNDLHVLAFALKDGEAKWNRKIGNGRLPTHQLHNMATPTPVTDGKHVWAFFGTGDLVCLEAASGDEVWRRNLRKDFVDYNTNHGMGNSPVLYDGKLFIACMHQGPSYLLALDAANGETQCEPASNLRRSQ